ncbi:hypothetical protein B0T25DRAFT_69883 [Lasiosphaeria hispida]|uniref:Zn(2)-C6 fungal-type domain-containing protein n=1 Tax=Lasiosphaeria hispida TaxID=260671 RepID=A0AAJ0ML98_9PEZI|nr:hypothetical protein B0T25DRAFT_69883 [Lasiosphaeria hispida]
MSSASPQHNGLQLQQQPSTRKTIRAKSIQTTKWGTACSQCASAKAKCSRQSNSQQSKCERCERLLKQCTNQVHRPRKAREAKPRSLNEARDYGSEEPGEALTPSSGYSPSPSADQRGTSSTCSSPRGGNSMSGRPSPQERRSIARSSSNYSNSSPENPREAGMPYATSHPRSQSRNPSYTGAVESDEELLAVFRNELMPQYPFVLIPSNMSADELNAWRPFLMSTIRMAASFKNAESMRGQMFQIMSYLADHMLLRAEHSIDLLMGVIVVLGWYHYHSMTHTQLNNLLCLAESLMSGLGINQPLFTQSREAITKTNEEKRLLLGLWYLRSVASGHFHMLQPIPFTATMSEYLEGLERDSEERSDDFLVYLVKIQHLSERIVETTTASIGSKAQEATVTKLQNTLRRSAGTLPHQLKSNGTAQP